MLRAYRSADVETVAVRTRVELRVEVAVRLGRAVERENAGVVLGGEARGHRIVAVDGDDVELPQRKACQSFKSNKDNKSSKGFMWEQIDLLSKGKIVLCGNKSITNRQANRWTNR